MTVGPDYVFLCVPRTASVAISRHWLIDYYNGKELNPADYHGQTVPLEHAHKFTFAVVRNPYTRMASLWRYINWPAEAERESYSAQWPGLLANPSMAQFVRWCADRVEPLWCNQTDFLSHVRVDRLLRFEALESGLMELPFVTVWHPLPLENVSRRPAMQADLTADAVSAINFHSEPDFSEFGYRKVREASELCA